MNESERVAKIVAGGVYPAVIVGLNVVPWFAFPDLPDRIATHFDLDGVANGSMPFALLIAFHAAYSVLIAAFLVRAVRRAHTHLPAQAALLTYLGIFVGLLAVATAWANDGVATWRDATLGVGAIAGALGSTLGFTFPVLLATNRLAGPPAATPASPPLPIAAGERAAWFGKASSVGFLMAAVANAVLGIAVLIVLSVPGVAIMLLGIAALLASFASVHVEVTSDGVKVHGAIPWPEIDLDLQDIEGASTSDISPMEWGGWGYRGSLRLFRRAAWVVRGGAALELALRGDRRFTVSVDDADEAAAVVNGLLAGPVTPRAG